MTVCPDPVVLVPTFNKVVEYQHIASQTLKKPSNYCKRAESNLLADEKGLQHWIQVAIWIIYHYLYLYIYYIPCVCKIECGPDSDSTTVTKLSRLKQSI